MSQASIMLFLCTGKDCRKVWKRLCNGSPAKWLKRHLEKVGAPHQLNIIETECMDHCEQAACLGCLQGRVGGFLTEIQSPHDVSRFLATLQSRSE